MISLFDATGVYQRQLETLRTAEDCDVFDDEALEELREDLAEARRLLEVAWLEEM